MHTVDFVLLHLPKLKENCYKYGNIKLRKKFFLYNLNFDTKNVVGLVYTFLTTFKFHISAHYPVSICK